jgi:4-amino-4-deoxy-L-arabinose transferase-like glycosyltransferase
VGICNSSGSGTVVQLSHHTKSMEQSRSEERFWLILAGVTVTVILIAAIRWSFAHPYGIHWDESGYINETLIDAQRLRSGLLLKLCGRILLKSGGRPPAYRLLADPVVALFGFHTTTARLVSLACFALSSWFIYLATSRIGSRIAGAFAVLVFCLSPEVISASIFFGTDAPLYLATSAMLCYLFKGWSNPSEHSRNWIGLGLAIGLGFLSKTSFFLIALPALAFWFVAGRWRKLGDPGWALPLKAGTLALLVAGPWWLLNIKGAVAYGKYARGFVRNSLGPPSIATWISWLNTVIQCLLGPGLSILIALVVIACLVRIAVRKEMILSPLQKSALGVCACAGVPIILAQLSGTNHLLRHISPAVIPLAITIGVLGDRTEWTRSWATITISGILFCAQLLMIVYPVVFPNTEPVDLGVVNGALPWRTMVRFDQWDWRAVREISKTCGTNSPQISYLGGGREFNPPAIEYPWAAAAASTRLSTFDFPNVTWLWRYEDGPLDWRKVMDSAAQSDLIITAPYYVGEVTTKEDRDNQHNSEFADQLSLDPRFQGPIRFQVGRFEPIELVVFLREALECHPGQNGFATHRATK